MSQNDPIKVYDARWEEGDFTTDQIHRFLEAVLIYGQELEVDTITICRDTRLGSAAVAEMALELSIESGFSVYLCAEPVSTPQSYFTTAWAAQYHHNTMGLTVTASHNPAQYTGLKVTVPVVQAIGLECGPRGGFTRIREIYHSRQALNKKSRGRLTVVDFSDEYIEYSMQLAGLHKNDLEGVHVVFDAMNGSAGPEIFKALQLCGVRIEPLRLMPNGNFPTGSPNPTSEGKMSRAISVAQQENRCLVIGTDGDGDRLVFGDRRGIWQAGFVSVPILSSFMGDLADTRMVKVLCDPKVNPIALQEWVKLNIEPVLFRNGHSQIKEFMKKNDVIAAVEESGHYYHKLPFEQFSIYCENSILTVFLLLKALKQNPDSFDTLWIKQSQIHTPGELNFQLADDQTRDLAMRTLLNWFDGERALLASTTKSGIDLQGTVVQKGIQFDGTHMTLSKEWYSGYIRNATNEKAVLRLYLSASSRELGMKIEQACNQILYRFNATKID
jgi:phosphomannomutase